MLVNVLMNLTTTLTTFFLTHLKNSVKISQFFVLIESVMLPVIIHFTHCSINRLNSIGTVTLSLINICR